jgi:hypothetical protein
MQLRHSIPLWLRAPRALTWLLLAAVLLALVAVVSPGNLPVVLYKCALVAIGAVIGYWVDRMVAPYARPDAYLVRDWRLGSTEPEGDADYPIVPGYMPAFCAASIRRALIVGVCVLGLTLGL